MFRARVLPTAVSAVVAQILMLAPATALERVEIDPTTVLVQVEPQDVEQTRAEGADGSSVVGGHLGALPGCAGVQAFAKKLDAGGSIVWELSAGAGKDCDLDGQPDGGGDPMFADMTSLDPDYVVSSTVHDAVYAPDGSIYFTGQLLVAWDDGGGLTAAWGAFVLHQAAAGEHLADVYLGPQPSGSPVQVPTCVVLCSALGATAMTQWGGRALAELEDSASFLDGLVLAGWKWSSANQGANDKDAFFAVLDLDLQTARWFTVFPYPGADLPLDVTVGDDGDVYATGYYGPDHDVFVARLAGQDGTLTHLFVGGGALDDWGDVVGITAAGEVEVEGTFTDTATFAGQVLTGDGPTGFRALLTPTLEPILIEVLDGGTSASQSAGGAAAAQTPAALKAAVGQQTLPSQPTGTQSNAPTAVDVLVGFAGTGTSPSLVNTSNNRYLVLYGDPQPDYDKVEVVFEVPILQGASVLDTVELELKSSYCTDLTVLLGGGGASAGVFYGIGGTQICPFDEPIVSVGIPAGVAEQQLGFSATSQPPAPLEVLLSMEVYGQLPSGCGGGICITPGDDEKVDEIMVNSEYP